MRPCDRQEIRSFLQDLKDHVSRSGLYIFPRDKNLQAMARLGITREQVKDLSLGLVVKDYHKGPDPDRGSPHNDVWVFGPLIDNEQLYLKFLDSGWSSGRKISCFSIHEAEFPLDYPCK